MKKILSFFVLLLFASTLLAQTTTLTFTGRDANNHFIPLNRVVITNLTKGWQETVYYPDTILVMSSVGIEDYGKVESFNLSQNSPNPFDGTSDFSLCLPKEGQVSIEVYDLNGKKITSYNNTLTAGCHVFRVLLSTAQSYFLTARSGNDQASIKMINTGNAGSNALLYIGEGNMQPLSVKLDNNSKGQTEHPFTIGDNMEYVGYAVVNGEEYESQHIQQTQNASENFILNFDCVANPNVSLQSLTVTNVLASSATLSANVTSNTDGQQLQRGFQYDTDAAFTNAINVACGTGNGNFSTNITGLQDATMYYVRAFATYHTTTTYSDAETFTTLCNPLNISISGNSSICNGSSTTLTATGADTYQWSPATGLNVQTGNAVIASPTESTVYTVTGTAANGCTGTANVSVVVNQTYNIGTTAEICPGESFNFFGQTLTAAGTYNHTLQTEQGCDSVITLTLSLKEVPNITVSGNTTICLGASTVLTATGASTYLWTPATGLSSTTSDVVTANPSTSTSYSVAGTAANGCTGYANVLVTVLTLPNISIVGNTDVCQGTSTILAANGAIAYQWSPATGLNTTIGNIVTATPNTSTLYTVTGIDANGCSNTASVQINVHSSPGTTIADNFCQGTSYNFYGQQLTQGGVYSHTLQSIYGCDSVITLILTQKNAPSVSITGERAICQNGNSILTANGANTYQWLPAEGMSTTLGPAVVVTPSVSTNYTVVGTAANGCTGSASAFVEVHPVYQTNISQSICQGQSYNFYGQILTNAGVYNHTLQSTHGCDSVITLTLFVQEISVNGTTQICENGSTTLTVTGVNNALWTPSTGLSSATGNTVIASPSSTTTYNVSGSSSSGCSLSTTFTIGVYPKYQINRTAAICQGQSYNFYGQQLSTSGTYSHTLQSVHGCDSIISLQLSVHPLPTVNITGDNAICEGDTATLTANGANTYQWSPATGLSATTGNSVSAYPAESVIYTVNGTDTNGCVGSATHLLVVDELPNISITGNTTVNYGSSTTLTATGASTYQWSTGATGNTLTVLPQSSTNYSVTGTNTAGCSSTQHVAVTVIPIAPSVNTLNVTNISDSSALVSGELLSHGGDANISVGFQYATSSSFSGASTVSASVGNFSANITGLAMNTTYYVRAYATNSVGVAYGNVETFVTLTETPVDGQPCPNAATLTDVDGNVYNTVQIGNQCWMKENLRTTKYADGTIIDLGSCMSSTIAYRYYPNNNSSNVNSYGYLYNWSAVMGNSSSSSCNPSGIQGICPNGWHVPSDAEWTQLINYVSSHSEYLCGGSGSNIAKSLASTTGWDSCTTSCAVGFIPSNNNATGFSALPAGEYHNGFGYFGDETYFWSSTQEGTGGSYCRSMSYWEATVYRSNYNRTDGWSVRCIKDDGRSSVITSVVSSITSNSAICGGNIIADGGAAVTDRGVCYNTTGMPTISDSCLHIGTGLGSFYQNLTNLNTNSTYYLRAYAVNAYGVEYGDKVSFTTWNFIPCPDAAMITDYDGNVYNTIQIGQQCWMRENLKTTHYADGSNIFLGTGTSTTIPYGYYPNNDANNVSVYGYLYNWKAVMGSFPSSSSNPSAVQGICPSGWHVPSDAEWTQLVDYLSSQNQYWCNGNSSSIAKSLANTTEWYSSLNTCAVGNNSSSNNATGFSAVAAGYYSYDVYQGFRECVSLWSSTESGTSDAYSRFLSYSQADIVRINRSKGAACPVRCIKGLSGQPCPDAATVTDVDGNIYNTVQMGQQCWMKENLRTTKYADGTSIPLNNGDVTSSNTAYRYYPDSSSSYVENYGFLYNWLAVMHNSSYSNSNPSGVQGACPTGWHVPSDLEWIQMLSYVKDQGQYVSAGCTSEYEDSEWSTYCIAKALASTQGWNNSLVVHTPGYNPSANDLTCFSALPAGTFSVSEFSNPGGYYGFGTVASFWTSSCKYASPRTYRYISTDDPNVHQSNYLVTTARSVRCVKNECGSLSSTIPTVTTELITGISPTAATSGGHVTSDGGASVTARGVCWSTSQNPTTNNSHTTDGVSVGRFTSNITSLTPNTTYYVRAYAINSVGTAYGNEISITTTNPNDGQPCQSATTLTDVDGNVYNTVQIGNQCWMKENLRTTKYADNTSIPMGSTHSYDVAYRYCPNNDASKVATYGYLYNWKAVMHDDSSCSSNLSGVQGICPNGWHVPSNAEWAQLTNYVSRQSLYVCSSSSYIAKALASTTGWNSSTKTCAVGNNPSTNNATGFSALPAGIYGGSYSGFGGSACFWSSTEADSYYAYYRSLAYGSAYVTYYYINKNCGFSVRCVKD